MAEHQNRRSSVTVVTRIIVAAVFGVWALAVLVEAWSLESHASPGDVGPGFMPSVVGVVLIALLLLEVATTWRHRSPEDTTSDDAAAPNRNQLLYCIALLGCTGLTFLVGVIPALVALVFWSMRFAEGRSLVRSSVTTAVLVGALYLLFGEVLNVRVPLVAF